MDHGTNRMTHWASQFSTLWHFRKVKKFVFRHNLSRQSGYSIEADILAIRLSQPYLVCRIWRKWKNTRSREGLVFGYPRLRTYLCCRGPKLFIDYGKITYIIIICSALAMGTDSPDEQSGFRPHFTGKLMRYTGTHSNAFSPYVRV